MTCGVREGGGTVGRRPPARQLAILMVEDDPLQARFLTECLRRVGLAEHLRVVGDGEAALSVLRQHHEGGTPRRPDLMLLDLGLPGLDGVEVLRRVRADADCGDIPVLVMSTSAEPGDVRRAYHGGANCYLTKPAGLADSCAMVEAIGWFWGRVATLPQ